MVFVLRPALLSGDIAVAQERESQQLPYQPFDESLMTFGHKSDFTVTGVGFIFDIKYRNVCLLMK